MFAGVACSTMKNLGRKAAKTLSTLAMELGKGFVGTAPLEPANLNPLLAAQSSKFVQAAQGTKILA